MEASLKHRRLPGLGPVIVLVAALAALAPPAAAELPTGLDANELACQKATFTATATYLRDVFSARHNCLDRVIKQVLPSNVNCFATLDDGGTGDEDTDRALENADVHLSQSVTVKCIGLRFDRLGFPGFCPGDPDPVYSVISHERCLRESADLLVDQLLNFEHPPLPGVVPQTDHNCQDLVARKASSMFVKELKARTSCLQDQYQAKLSPVIECRSEEDRFDPHTGDTSTDSGIVQAHMRTLRGIANGCLRADLTALGFPHQCVNPENSEFTISALVECMFDTHHGELIRFMDRLSPPTSICGNGDLDFTEQCDDGDNSFSQGDLCRSNCTVIFSCGDTNDDGSQTINDALYLQRVIVGLESCALEVCDVDNSGGINTTDVLLMLRKAAGLDVTLSCPAPLALTCGNSIVDKFESCDDGDTQWAFGQVCNSSCQRLACGDPNGSGTITALDASYLMRVAVTLETCDLSVCDVDSNGVVSTADVLLVLQASTGLSPQALSCSF